MGDIVKHIKLQHDAENGVVLVDQDGVRLVTRADIDEHFNDVLAWWRRNCGGAKVIFVVSYDGFVVNLRESEYFATRMKACTSECAVAVVRYGGDALQRSAARLRSVKTHSPSHLYESRDQALAVARRLRAGEAPTRPT